MRIRALERSEPAAVEDIVERRRSTPPAGSLTAPAIHNGWVFTGWLVNGEEYPWSVPTIVVNVEGGITTAFTRYRQPCDTNGDGNINVLDLIDVLLCFGQPAVPGCEAEDVNGDGTVNVLDLIDVLLAFGTAYP